MTSTPMPSDDLEARHLLSQAENRQLHETIVALRQEMELQAEETKQNMQRVCAVADAENLQLKSTIGELRRELESMQLDKETSVVRALAESGKEITQLRA